MEACFLCVLPNDKKTNKCLQFSISSACPLFEKYKLDSPRATQHSYFRGALPGQHVLFLLSADSCPRPVLVAVVRTGLGPSLSGLQGSGRGQNVLEVFSGLCWSLRSRCFLCCAADGEKNISIQTIVLYTAAAELCRFLCVTECI